MRCPILLATVALLATSALPAAAAVLPIADLDLRLGAGLRGRDVAITSGGIEDEGEWDRSGRYFAEALLAPFPGALGRLLAGIKAVADRSEGDGTDYEVLGLQAEVGYGLTVIPFLRIELLPYIGIGRATLDDGVEADDASSLEYGANLNAVLTSGGGFQIGAGVGWARSQSEHGLADVDQSGPVGAVFVGYRL